MASEKIGSYVWSNSGAGSGVGGGTAGAGQGSLNQSQMSTPQFSFGERNPAAQEEIDRFIMQEQYLDTLKDCFKSLAVELLNMIDCSEEAKKNYQALGESFSAFGNLKGAHID